MSESERPAFIGPQVSWVECYICGQVIRDMSRVEGIDVSEPDEYYPRMKPVCRSHVDDDLDRGEGVRTDGGELEDDTTERVIYNPEDAEQITGHLDHEGFSAWRFGAGELVDIHISCADCDVRWIIEDVPKDQAENPGKYLDSEGSR